MLSETDIKKVKKLAANIRKDVVMMMGGKGQTGHLGGSFSSADIVATLYGHKMKIDPKNPNWEDRDKFIYSKGHAAIAQYAALAEVGYFPKEELQTIKCLGSRLQGHPDRTKTPGIEAGTGSLGQGLSIALGLALAMRLDKKDNKTYCVMGDGELDEGQIWEAAMAAAAYKLDNLVGIVDYNKIQATGFTADRLDQGDMAAKWAAFGWNVIEVDGHDIEQIISAFDKAELVKGKPTVVIANTIKGKGASFAENTAAYHNAALTQDLYNRLIGELDEQLARLV